MIRSLQKREIVCTEPESVMMKTILPDSHIQENVQKLCDKVYRINPGIIGNVHLKEYWNQNPPEPTQAVPGGYIKSI